MDDFWDMTGKICLAVFLISFFAMASSCADQAQRDHNECVIAAKTPAQAILCKGAR